MENPVQKKPTKHTCFFFFFITTILIFFFFPVLFLFLWFFFLFYSLIAFCSLSAGPLLSIAEVAIEHRTFHKKKKQLRERKRNDNGHYRKSTQEIKPFFLFLSFTVQHLRVGAIGAQHTRPAISFPHRHTNTHIVLQRIRCTAERCMYIVSIGLQHIYLYYTTPIPPHARHAAILQSSPTVPKK